MSKKYCAGHILYLASLLHRIAKKNKFILYLLSVIDRAVSKEHVIINLTSVKNYLNYSK